MSLFNSHPLQMHQEHHHQDYHMLDFFDEITMPSPPPEAPLPTPDSVIHLIMATFSFTLSLTLVVLPILCPQQPSWFPWLSALTTFTIVTTNRLHSRLGHTPWTDTFEIGRDTLVVVITALISPFLPSTPSPCWARTSDPSLPASERLIVECVFDCPSLTAFGRVERVVLWVY
ncbi:hypothetical protein IWZ03DRAFT_174253 [Phyllosticta citriasiana]|uniref:Uncharacterized protein n=1 Tax=Phyllosticta citriasiana TaxID=595635 RepID=A0ABR1KM03_9PEZI